VQIRHGFVHAEHHLLVAIDTGRLSAGAIMVVEVRRHVLADYSGVSLIDEILEMVSDTLFHLLYGQLGCHVFAPEVKMSSDGPTPSPGETGPRLANRGTPSLWPGAHIGFNS
jgi:hypothetical protein